MTQRRIIVALAALAGCSASAFASGAVPNGARVEASGFISVDAVAASPPASLMPSASNGHDPDFFQRVTGLSAAQAAERSAGLGSIMDEFKRIAPLLTKHEEGNFDPEQHSLDRRAPYRIIIPFKRDPKRTLAKYTKDPRLVAVLANRYSREELRAIGDPWLARFKKHRLATDYMSNPVVGEVRFHLSVSEPEFNAIAAKEGWRLPDQVDFLFSDPVYGPAIATSLAPVVRLLPQMDRATVASYGYALLGGRIVMRDGCLFVRRPNVPDRLAYFAREVALTTDTQGFLSLAERGPTPRHLGRVGELFTWTGPIEMTDQTPVPSQLHERCGDAPLEHVGIPRAAGIFQSIGHMNYLADRRRISPEAAWQQFVACIEQRRLDELGGFVQCREP